MNRSFVWMIALGALLASVEPGYSRENTSDLSLIVQQSLQRVDTTWRKLHEQNAAFHQEAAALEREQRDAARALQAAEAKNMAATPNAVRDAEARLMEATAKVVTQREHARVAAHKALVEVRKEIGALVTRLHQSRNSTELGPTMRVDKYLAGIQTVGENIESILIDAAGDGEGVLALALLKHRFDQLTEERTDSAPAGLQTNLLEGLEQHQQVLDDLITLSVALGQSHQRQRQLLSVGAQLGLASLTEEAIVGGKRNAQALARHFKTEMDRVRATDGEIKHLLERHLPPGKQPNSKETARAALGSLAGPNGRIF